MTTDDTATDGGLSSHLRILGDLFGPERLLQRVHELFAEDPTVIADLRHEVETLTAERDQAQGAAQAAYARVLELDRRLTEARLSAALRCGARTLTGDITCNRPAGHDGLHVGGSPDHGLHYFGDDVVAATVRCGVRVDLTVTAEPMAPYVECDLEDGHATRHSGPIRW